MSPIMLMLAWGGEPVLFGVSFAAALASDMIDGFLARRLKLDSEIGAKLDSWSDLCMYVSAAIGVWLLWPQFIRQERVCTVAVVFGYVVPILFGFAKYRRLTSYHTWGAKVSAVVVSVAAFIMFIFGITWPFWVATPVFVVSSIEEVCITAVLPAWRANVPSFRHALRVRTLLLAPSGGTEAGRS
jgi:CDP-diacylglycerol--glycerol-3-phosphate 3-phosphatidyltransferase